MTHFTTLPELTGTSIIPSPLSFIPSTTTTTSTLILPSSQLIQLLPTIKSLSNTKLILQVSTLDNDSDHSQILALNQSGFNFVYSPTTELALQNQHHLNTIINTTGKAVLHFGEFSHQPLITSSIDPTPATNGHSSIPAFTATSYTGSPAPSHLIIALGNTTALQSSLPSNAALLSLTLYRPLSSAQIRALVPASVQKIVVLEQTAKSLTNWSPVFLDVVGAFAESDEDTVVPVILSGILGHIADGQAQAAMATIERELLPFCTILLFFFFAPRFSSCFFRSRVLTQMSPSINF